jgi:ethanolamine utilization protein EutQ (cupin superfamily)
MAVKRPASPPRRSQELTVGTVTEHIMLFGSDEPDRILERDEELLLGAPRPSPLPVRLWREHEPLTVVHYPTEFRARPFAPPRGVFENDKLRVEWQTMDNRQPFYHRNCDVDEISYQIAGERTLMTELGVVEHRPGEFSRLPRGVAHDNWGRGESHLLFYTPAPVTEERRAVAESQPVLPPFEGWEPGALNEAVTQCMGSPGHDITVFPIDERRLLEQVYQEKARLAVLRGDGAPGTTWLYRGQHLRLGIAVAPASDGRVYQRLLDADEIQYQVRGRRVVVTQRGLVELGPGDFLRIPLGIAHTSVAPENTEYLRLLCDRDLPQIAATDRVAEPCSPERLATARGAL